MKSKFSLLIVLLVFLFASCHEEENLQTLQESELELLNREALDKIKNGYKPIVKSDPEAFKKIILEDKELLKLIERSGFQVNDIINGSLESRTDCNGFNYSCDVLRFYADANGDGLFDQAEYNIVLGVELGTYSISDAISLGYPYINNVRFLSCFAMCEGSDCTAFSFWDLVLYARVQHNTLQSQHCY